MRSEILEWMREESYVPTTPDEERLKGGRHGTILCELVRIGSSIVDNCPRGTYEDRLNPVRPTYSNDSKLIKKT